jgi:hypothetical protein
MISLYYTTIWFVLCAYSAYLCTMSDIHFCRMMKVSFRQHDGRNNWSKPAWQSISFSVFFGVIFFAFSFCCSCRISVFQSLFTCVVFFFYLAIALPFLRFTISDYTFDIFKLFVYPSCLCIVTQLNLQISTMQLADQFLTGIINLHLDIFMLGLFSQSRINNLIV